MNEKSELPASKSRLSHFMHNGFSRGILIASTLVLSSCSGDAYYVERNSSNQGVPSSAGGSELPHISGDAPTYSSLEDALADSSFAVRGTVIAKLGSESARNPNAGTPRFATYKLRITDDLGADLPSNTITLSDIDRDTQVVDIPLPEILVGMEGIFLLNTADVPGTPALKSGPSFYPVEILEPVTPNASVFADQEERFSALSITEVTELLATHVNMSDPVVQYARDVSE